MREAGRSTRFAAGQTLMAAGDPSTYVLLLESGLAKVVLRSADGLAVVAALIGRGELVGEFGVVNATTRSAEVTAVTAGTATVVGGPRFLRLFAAHTCVRDLVGAATRRRQKRADVRHLALARDVPTRVAAILLDWARAHGVAARDGLRVDGPTQCDVAMAAAASTKSVEAVYGRLRAAGLLVSGRRTYLLPDPDALAAVVAGSPVPDIRE